MPLQCLEEETDTNQRLKLVTYIYMMRLLLDIYLQDKNTCESIKLGASDLGSATREGFPELMLELRLKEAN